MSNNSQYPFPDEWAPPKKKEKPDYGLQAAKAMYFSTNRLGYRLFNDTATFNALVEFAQGRQSTDNIYKMLGFFKDTGATQDDNGALAYLDVQVINLITKYVNRTVAKLQRYKYDVNFTAVDPVSVNEAKEKAMQIKTLYGMKNWYDTMKVNPQQYFPELDVAILNDYPDEQMFNLSSNSKIKKIVDAEKTMKLVNNTLNDMGQVMREVDWDMVVIGRGHIHCYQDENGIPRSKRINPRFWGGSYVENEDYSKQEYSFFIDFISLNQFKTEAQGKLTKAEIDDIIAQHAYPNSAASFGTAPQYYDNYDGLEYIPVMRFYYLSNDNVAYKIWNNGETGNRMMDVTHYNYFPTENSQREQKVVQNSFTSVYGGTWIIDSETVYNYGRKQIPKTMLVNSRLPIITFAPNMKEGRIVSMVAQMVEPAFMINVAWNRLKDIIAKGWTGIVELDMTALENVALGKGGQPWQPKEAIDFFLQSRIVAKRQTTSQYGQAMGRALEESNIGLKIADYLTTITTSIQFLDELSGSTVVEGAKLPDRLTTGAMKANVVSGTDAIEYLVNGHLQTFKQTCHMNMLLTQEAKRSAVALQGLIPALGTSPEYFEVPEDIAYCDLGLQMQPEPTQEEWIEFFMEMQEAVKEGRLNASDSAYIRQIKDMTLARYVMANREKMNEAKAMAIKQQEMKFQSQIATQSVQEKLQMELAVEDKKLSNAKELMAIQARIDAALQDRKMMMEGEQANITNRVQKQIKQQEGIDSVLKEAMRSRSEEYKADKQHEGKLIAAEAQVTAAKLTKQNKPKPSAKT